MLTWIVNAYSFVMISACWFIALSWLEDKLVKEHEPLYWPLKLVILAFSLFAGYGLTFKYVPIDGSDCRPAGPGIYSDC